MAERGTDEATARSIRALFDLPRFVLVAVERWAGWGRLTLVPRDTLARPYARCTRRLEQYLFRLTGDSTKDRH